LVASGLKSDGNISARMVEVQSIHGNLAVQAPNFTNVSTSSRYSYMYRFEFDYAKMNYLVFDVDVAVGWRGTSMTMTIK